MKTTKKLNIISLAVAIALCSTAYASDDEVHDADPRNTAWRGGIASDDSGEVKLVAGGGFKDLYGGGEYATQTIMIGEYFSQKEDFRFRLANFDERFGGIYVDTYLTDTANMYTAGYMLPLTATNGKTLLFPSVNYSYVDFDTKEIAKVGNVNLQGTELEGFLPINSGNVKHLLGDNEAHLASVNLYGLQPWNDTFYTVFQAFAGSSYGGVEMEMVDVMLLQGTRTKIGDAVFNIYLEAKYTNIKLTELNNPIGNKDYLRGEETKISFGFDWRF